MIRELGNVELLKLCDNVLTVSFFLESRNCALHLRTMLDLQRVRREDLDISGHECKGRLVTVTLQAPPQHAWKRNPRE